MYSKDILIISVYYGKVKIHRFTANTEQETIGESYGLFYISLLSSYNTNQYRDLLSNRFFPYWMKSLSHTFLFGSKLS